MLHDRYKQSYRNTVESFGTLGVGIREMRLAEKMVEVVDFVFIMALYQSYLYPWKLQLCYVVFFDRFMSVVFDYDQLVTNS